VEGSGCSPLCTVPSCGDGFLDAGEECDLGAENGVEGSGCTATCALPEGG
jgi:cysteine-rich repeat protein